MLSVSQGRICRVLGYAFGLAAMTHVVSIVIAGLAPRFLSTVIVCRRGGCALTNSSAGLLSDSMRRAEMMTPEAVMALDRYLALPTVRTQFFVAQLAMDLPMVGLLAAVAIGVHQLGQRRGDDVAQALAWFRGGAILALVAALLIPLGESFRTTLVHRAFEPAARLTLSVEVGQSLLNVLLALVAIAVTWALAVGVKAERDLSEIV